MFQIEDDQSDISIHALREEGDSSALSRCAAPAEFLSTPSARRATQPAFALSGVEGISIHALREEGDRLACCGCILA